MIKMVIPPFPAHIPKDDSHLIQASTAHTTTVCPFLDASKIRNPNHCNQKLKWLLRKGANRQNPYFKRRSFSDVFSHLLDDDLA